MVLQMTQIIEIATQKVKNGFEKTYLEKYIGKGHIMINIIVNKTLLQTANLNAFFRRVSSLSVGSSYTAFSTTSSSVRIFRLVRVTSKSKLSGKASDQTTEIMRESDKEVLQFLS